MGARYGELRPDEYLFLYASGMLPGQYRAPSGRERMDALRIVLSIERALDMDVELSCAIELIANGVLDHRQVYTPSNMVEPYLLEPALTLGSYRTGTSIGFDTLSHRLDARIGSWASQTLGL